MPAVEPGGLSGGDEELAAVGVGSCVGHGEAEGFVLELEVFVVELVAPDGSASSSVSPSEITALDHEVGDDSMEGAALELQGLSAVSQLALAQLSEVFNGLGDGLSEEVDDDVPGSCASDINGEGKLMGDRFLGKRGGTEARLQKAAATRSRNTRLAFIFIITRNKSLAVVQDIRGKWIIKLARILCLFLGTFA